jgi:hypothetical protein
MLSERDEQILGELELDLGRTPRRRFRAIALLIGVVLICGGELLATPSGIALAVVGFLGMVLASAGYVADARSRRSRHQRTRIARLLPLLRRW